MSGFERMQGHVLERYGVRAESRHVEVEELKGRAHVLVAGEGPALVLVPGGGAPALGWAPLMAGLDDFTLYAIDRPGFGLTDPVPHRTEHIRSMAVRFLLQVLDALGLEQPVFVANSMGSLWTTWLALDEPHRVAAMTHIGCPALILGTSAPLPMRLMSFPPVGRLMLRSRPPSAGQVEQMFFMMGEDVSRHPELRDAMVEFQRMGPYASSWLDLLHAVIRIRGARPQVALTADQLSRIQQPVQLIWGSDDPFGTPEVGERAQQIIADAEFHEVSGGHAPWLTQAERIAGLALPFLGKYAEG